MDRRDATDEEARALASTLRLRILRVCLGEGRTNKEIAQALYVTLKTVELHLSNAYRKLGVRSRRELAGALAEA